MSNSSQDGGKNPGIPERRLHARSKDISLAYVELGESNGGILLNISEGGLVLTAAEPLPDSAVLQMRFQLPGSNDWIEARGKIAWISESRREAGVRFVDISEDSRNRIKVWMCSMLTSAALSPVASQASSGPVQTSNSLPAETGAIASAKSPAIPPLPGMSITDSIAAAKAAIASLQANKSTTRPSYRAPAAAEDHVSRLENPMAKPDRRQHARRRDIALAYIELGGDNGGIIVNLSAGGLVVAAAEPLQGNRVPRMRFQLPDCADWIEASGEIVWISDSKREAGVRFLTLTDEDRERIRAWVSSESASHESPRVTNRSHERGGRILEMPPARLRTSAPTPSADMFEHSVLQNSDASPAPFSTQGIHGGRASAAATAPAFPSQKLEKQPTVIPEVFLPVQPVRVVVQRRSWGNIVGIVIVASAVSFLAGWYVAGPETRRQVLRMFEGRTADTNNPSAKTASPSTAAGGTISSPSVQQTVPKVNPAPLSPTRRAATLPNSPPPNVNPQAREVENPSARVAANVSRLQLAEPRVEEHRSGNAPSNAMAGTPQRPVEIAPAQSVSKDLPPTKESVGITPSPTAGQTIQNQTEVARSAGGAPTPNPPSAASTASPEVFKVTVTVSVSPYPSIRVPAELRSQMSRQGASLQIGRLSSRVEPVYPAEAERQRIEGTVRVHAIIGRDGAVQSVALLSGTSLLAQAVTNAVLRWKYQPASIGGQAVEAEEDIVVVFKLVNQASRPN